MYNYINMENSQVNPSTVHVRNTGLQRFFARYLLQRAMSVFKWEMPEQWSRDYFLYSLYCYGYVTVINTNKFGVIPQHCSLRGYDVFYRPNEVVVANPLFSGIQTARIGVNCTLFRLQPDYGGIMDLVNYYADQMALCSESISINLINSHVSYAFVTKSKSGAETMKKVFDRVSSGDPAVFFDKDVMGDDGTPSWFPFFQNVGQNYIADKVLSDMRKLVAMFDTEIGIPNANTDKKERLVTDEVNANNVETESKVAVWLEQLQKTCEDTREMFGIDVSVDWRYKPVEMEVENGTDNNRDVPIR